MQDNLSLLVETILWLLVTLAIGAVGGIIGKKLRIPAGAMVGAMVLVVVFNFISSKAIFPTELRTFVQLVSGALIGSRLKRRDVGELKKVFLPSILLIIGMFVMCLSVGTLLYKFGGLELNTALFCAAPGGMSDMGLIAEDLGANMGIVSILQLSRILGVFIIYPPIIRALAKRGIIHPKEEAPGEVARAVDPRQVTPRSPLKQRAIGVVIMMAASATGGILVMLTGLPAGALIGAMIASALVSILVPQAYFPKSIRPAIQIMSGAYIGARMAKETVLSMGELVLPIIILTLAMLVFTFVIAFLQHKITKLDLGTAIMSGTPGGLQEISLMAEDMGYDAPKIAVMHTFRLLCVISFFPTMLTIVLNLVG